MWLEFKKAKIKQYAASNQANGEKKISSGKFENKELKPLLDKTVYVRIKGHDKSFVTIVKLNKVKSYKVPYISDSVLKDFVNKEITLDIVDIE